MLLARFTLSRPTPGITISRHFHQSLPRPAHYINANLEVFNKVAIQGSQSRVVLVDFYADWCKPCHILRPILERITSSDAKADVDLVTVDTESEDGFKLLSEYRVRAMPTVVAFKDGVEVGRFVGALPEREVHEFVKHL